MSHSSLSVALLASHPPCGSLWAAPKAPRGPRFPSGQFASLTRREKPFIAHFAGGARNVARNLVGQLTPSTVRAPVLAFFRRQNGRAFFPPLPIAALLHRGWRLANSKECHLGCYSVAWVFSRRKKTLSIWCKICPISAGWEALMCLEYFSNKKASAGSNPRWPFSEP